MIAWHPRSERPTTATTAIIAAPPAPDDDPEVGWALLPGMFYYDPDGYWRTEEERDILLLPEFWWCAEADLIAHLMPRIRTRSNGHG